MTGAILMLVDPNLDEAIATGLEPRWSMFLEYWLSLGKRLKRLPSRQDIDPAHMPMRLLPNVFLVDVIHAANGTAQTRFCCRLIGAEIGYVEKLRMGVYLDDTYDVERLREIEEHYRDAMRGYIRISSISPPRESPVRVNECQVVVLPLADKTGEIGHLLGFAIYNLTESRPPART